MGEEAEDELNRAEMVEEHLCVRGECPICDGDEPAYDDEDSWFGED